MANNGVDLEVAVVAMNDHAFAFVVFVGTPAHYAKLERIEVLVNGVFVYRGREGYFIVVSFALLSAKTYP